jgi:queuine/archaeosine tRNA-ribosyltransferase
MIQEVGLERVKRVTDFVLSIALETPSFFYVDREGRYDSSPEAVRERARKMLITMALNPSRPILEKYAGRHYWERWPKKIYRDGGED